MAARKLADHERARIARKMSAQIRFKPDQVKFFAVSNRRRMIEQVAQWIVSLAVGQHRGIAKMRVTIETAE